MFNTVKMEVNPRTLCTADRFLAAETRLSSVEKSLETLISQFGIQINTLTEKINTIETQLNRLEKSSESRCDTLKSGLEDVKVETKSIIERMNESRSQSIKLNAAFREEIDDVRVSLTRQVGMINQRVDEYLGAQDGFIVPAAE